MKPVPARQRGPVNVMEEMAMPIEFTHVPGRGRSTNSALPFFYDFTEAAPKLTQIEDAGFRRIVVDDEAGLLTNMDLAGQAVETTSSLEVILAHWAGVVAPVVAARQIAALDARSAGRLSLRILSEPLSESDAESRPAGYAAVWQRIDEYLVLLKRLWSNERPLDHEGAFYSVRSGFVPRKSPRGAGIGIRMGGLTGTALKVAGRHADVFELSGGSPDEVRQLMERAKIAAAECGRANRLRFALPVHVGRGGEVSRAGGGPRFDAVVVSEAPAQVALALLPYAALGIGEFMIGGIDDPRAFEAFGLQALPLVRNSVARQEADFVPARRVLMRSAHSGLRYGG